MATTGGGKKNLSSFLLKCSLTGFIGTESRRELGGKLPTEPASGKLCLRDNELAV